ncbi:DUF6925 family protein [Hansschlegelia zhihuaiae]|uniref:Uncharacterized protein n=1 Tax=Hansschlegelia zhihuaiae TaxID=405005 RepID=A0A4Q0M816_9HYPH|nr:hypothetical protein [Hansschlegelia zhihuaiae]RXF69247.1 hypothetical protein EK403_18855 [Hansschlegelia zhihuaiae]
MTEVAALLERHIGSHETHWHLGTFGVVAEFMRDADEPAAFPGDHGLAAFTARGAIRLEPADGLTPFAYETAMSRARTWSQQVALCLPRDACAMNRRSVVTELGRDLDAVRADDRGAPLFDLGLDRLQVDACVRTNDDRLIDVLRESEGRSLFDVSTSALMAVLKASPHRVFVTRFGRIEVFQLIPVDGSASPPGAASPPERIVRLAEETVETRYLLDEDAWIPGVTRPALGSQATPSIGDEALSSRPRSAPASISRDEMRRAFPIGALVGMLPTERASPNPRIPSIEPEISVPIIQLTLWTKSNLVFESAACRERLTSFSSARKTKKEMIDVITKRSSVDRGVRPHGQYRHSSGHAQNRHIGHSSLDVGKSGGAPRARDLLSEGGSRPDLSQTPVHP